MKVAFLTPEYPHPKIKNGGGIGTSIFNLAKALNHLGHEVTILVYGQDTDDFFVENEISFFKIKNIKVKTLSLFLTQRKVQRLINRLYKSNKIDIVEAPDWTGFTSFVRPNCPIVIRENGSDTYFCFLDGRNVKYKNKFLEKLALKKADGLISVSNFTGNLTNELFKLNKRFTVIPNSIDTSAFVPQKPEGNKISVLYFGTLIRKKGLFELPKIFNLVHQKNKEIELILVGNDSSDIQTGSFSTWKLIEPIFSRSATSKVTYLGPVSYSKVQSLVREATVCVFPTFAEALPVSWLEAMAMEKAIVASDIGWAKEMIEDGKEGYLVHPKKHEQYANYILEMIDDKKKRIAFGKAARIKVKENFDHIHIAKRSVEFYEKLLKS